MKSDQTDLIALKEYSIQFFCLQFDARMLEKEKRKLAEKDLKKEIKKPRL